MRLKKSLKNSTYAVIMQFLTIVLAFAVRTIFIKTLDVKYLGVNGLFTNILSILSLSELGLGTAITFSLYKPLAENNKPEICMLMALVKKLYRVISITVMGIGLLILPFLDFFIKDSPDIPNLKFIYFLYLLNVSLSYLYSHKRIILFADQKDYLNILNKGIANFLKSVIQIIILLYFQSFIYYLITQFVCLFLSNVVISRKVDKEYKYLNSENITKMDKNRKRELIKKCYALFFHKIGYVVVFSTDNILIAKYIGLSWTGLYSNYVLIINVVKTFLNQMLGGITGSVGNLNYTATTEKKYEIFNIVMFVYFWIYGFSVISLCILLNPFIELWIGKEYLIDQPIILVALVNVFVSGMRQPTNTFKTSLGLVWVDRYKPIAEAVINLVLSIILLKSMGLIGVFLGTLISTITTSFWIDPVVLFRHQYPDKIWQYFIRYFIYTMTVVIAGSITWFVAYQIDGNTILIFIIRMFICLIIPNILFACCYCRTKRFLYLYNLLKNTFSKFISKYNFL